MKKYNLINDVLGWLCFAVAAVTYLLTIEPTASFWDCPEFISQGGKLEVGHPPGNPIFMITARFFVTLFGGISQAAVAVNSMSALLSAATILLLFWTITHLAKKLLVADDAPSVSLPKMIAIMGAGLCGALAYTWSDTFWFSAVEGEVYAFSSFCTALVFWLILKWENRADQPHSDRYLVLIAYVIGVSIAVHLLNLLCIPAIVLVFYFRKYKNVNAKGALIALGVSVVLVAAILYGLVPGFIKVAQGFELFCVNSLGMGYNGGVMVYAVVLLAVFGWAIYALYRGKSAMQIKLSMLSVAILSGLTFATDSGIVWALLILALAIYLLGFCPKVPVRIFTLIVLSIAVIFIGYASYALLLIRASANTPMNQNAPDNVFALSSYLNREQYGQRPLFIGPAYAEQLDVKQYNDGNSTLYYVEIDEKGNIATKPVDTIYRDAAGSAIDNGKRSYAKVAKSSPDEPDRYVHESYTPDYATVPDLDMIFTRIYSNDANHVAGYKSWGLYENVDLDNLRNIVPANQYKQWIEQGIIPLYELGPYLTHMQDINLREDGSEPVPAWKASFADNLRYFLNYQLNHMYWRYFMWNFAGRQNDIQGNGEPNLGNWISGIPFIDNYRLGDQSKLPMEFTTGNKGHNVFYMLPLILGLLGIIWQALMQHRHAPNRGIEQFWVIFFLFFMTGVAIVLYLNQTPGQPRERDYAFAGSFYAFAIWIGLGVPAISRMLYDLFSMGKKAKSDEKQRGAVSVTASAVALAIGIAVPVQMVSQTWDDHDRSHRYAARDFGANYLNSVGENAIIFTNGDNDTFPLWYNQEVEGVRTDVRVVNLSYLSTDWYANQQRHPYYDAAAVPMLADPTNYAYDKLAYSFVDPYFDRNGDKPGAKSNPVAALDGLAEFYASKPSTMYTATPISLLATPYMYAPVDKEMVIEAFGLNPNSPSDTAYVLPYITDVPMNALSGSGFALNKLLSFDIVANSIADGFQRPVYFATTVPNSYYLGLDKYMYSTGMAQQVAPFIDAPASPLATKAYENIVSKYQWGGLDDEQYNDNLYLDETVRRMVSTTRNSIIEAAGQLALLGDAPASDFAIEWAQTNGLPVPQNRYDMARYLLDLMAEKLPEKAMRHESMTDISSIELYLHMYAKTGNEADLEHAQALIDKALPRYASFITYMASLKPSQLANMSQADRYAARYVSLLIGYQNYIDLAKALRGRDDIAPELWADALAALDLTDGMYTYNFAFLQEDLSDVEVEHMINNPTWRGITQQILSIYKLNDAAGIDRAEYTEHLLAPLGLTVEEVARFNRL